jgi:RNAse (barnase) inhibitor barstar
VGGRLAEVLAGERAPGCYRWPSRAHPHAVGRDLAAAGWTLHRIDGRAVTSAAELFERCADALAFPKWFGHNWDALADCLGDLSWLPGRGHVLLWDRYGVLARLDPKAWGMVCRVLSRAAENRRAGGAEPLFVLLRGAGPVVRPDDGTPIPTIL